ncbi:hypothetical protein BDZ89DRAFT_1062427 [Hymenopellis radicata]|nr:hypothetical protein BDZ89DRAFT_1062427 [Hymenopellis radicata]
MLAVSARVIIVSSQWASLAFDHHHERTALRCPRTSPLLGQPLAFPLLTLFIWHGLIPTDW